MINYQTNNYDIASNKIYPGSPNILGNPTHVDIYGYGGLKCYSQSNYNITNDGYLTDGAITASNGRSTYGQILYIRSNNKYYQCYDDNDNPKYKQLPGLTTGSPTFPGLTSSAGILISTGSLSGSTATMSVGYYTPGTITSVGLATFGSLLVPGNTQLGNAATDTTSVWGTLNVVYNSSTSGSITSDAKGNLILDGSGAGGVEITDGLMYLGSIPIQSGSYGGPNYNGGMISSSMKIVALHGFANATNDGDASFEVDINGNLQCASLKETSLRQYKHEIHYITESQLLNISKLKPVTFLYNQDVPQDVNDTRLRQAGFIAQQVQQIYPEVAWYKDGQLAGLQYQRLTAYLTRGIQELAEQNKLLKSRVQSLEQLVNGILQGAE